MRAIWIKTDLSYEAVDLADPIFKSQERYTGGWMEIVRVPCPTMPIMPLKGYPKTIVMLIDEEGKLKGKAANLVGSILYDTPRHGDAIVGDLLLVAEGMGPEGPDLMGLDARVEEDLMIWLNATTKKINERLRKMGVTR